jgi:hypothetical protein
MRQSKSALFIARDIFACPTKRHWVILDVRRDRYLCLTRAEFDSLGISCQAPHHIHEDRSEERPLSQADLGSLQNELLDRGILTANPEHSQEKDSLCPVVPSPFPLQPPSPQSKWRLLNAFPAFLYACWKANRSLSINPLHTTIEDLVRRKKRMPQPLGLRRQPHELSSTICVFNSLRPFYPKPYVCLFDSLALLEMLAIYGGFPTLVFGVTTDPFHAHCWLQMENTVLNDSPAAVRAYTPIMRI